LEVHEITARSTAQIEDAIGAFALECAKKGLDVLGDVMVPSPLPKCLGPAFIGFEDSSADGVDENAPVPLGVSIS
jgi:hypothetical protein